MVKIVDGREIARKINAAVKEEVEKISSLAGRRPKLLSIIVGKGSDAEIYVNMQKKTAEIVGIEFDILRFDSGVSQETLSNKIKKLNADEAVTAVILQKPLPDSLDHNKLLFSMDPRKDAEGIHPYNLGKILRREAYIVPCTPGAIMKILRVENVDLYGKEVVIIGHSAIVGKPLSLMMLNENATTTVCHIATFQKGDLPAHVKRADVLIVAVGSPELIKADWLKKGAVVIDVGINKIEERLVGDVEFVKAQNVASIISPVPGGVGPVTVSILMRNVLRAYKEQNHGI